MFPKEYCRLGGGQARDEPLRFLGMWGKAVWAGGGGGGAAPGAAGAAAALLGPGPELRLGLLPPAPAPAPPGAVVGLERGEEVDGPPAPPAGLLALSLAESLSERAALLGPSEGWAIFIFLQLGRTRYCRGRGPF